jgi:hypothetical protein
MRFSTLLVPVAMATSVLADGAAIASSLATISNATIALNSSVNSFRADGDPLKLLPIIVQATTLLNDIKSGTKTASASANLTLDETLTVASSTLALVSNVESTLDNIVAAKALFALELVGPVILLNLNQEKTATDQFSAAVVSKVPAALQATALSIIAPIDTAFTAAIAAYKWVL